MKYDPIHKFQTGLDALEFRQLIVNYLPEFIDTNHIFWDTETRGKVEVWMEKFSQNYVYPEQEFLQLCCTFLNRYVNSILITGIDPLEYFKMFIFRKIVLYPVNPYDTNGQVRKIELLPHGDCGCGIEMSNYEPFYMLYYEESNFLSPHYQSIRPKNEPPLPR